MPLRAHGLIQDSRYFRTEQMGRGIVHGSGEGQYWFRPRASGAADDTSTQAGIGGMLQGLRMGVAVVPGPLRSGIDTEADLERANREWLTFTVSDI